MSKVPLRYPSRGMHYYFRWVLFWAACAGVFPVSGIYYQNMFKLGFSWYSPFTIYSMLLLSGYATIEIVSLDYTIRNLNEDSLTAKESGQLYSNEVMHFHEV